MILFERKANKILELYTKLFTEDLAGDVATFR